MYVSCVLALFAGLGNCSVNTDTISKVLSVNTDTISRVLDVGKSYGCAAFSFAQESSSTASAAEFAKELLSAESAAKFAEKLLSTVSAAEFAKKLLSTASATDLPKELLSTAPATDLPKQLLSTASAAEFAKELLGTASAAEFAKKLLSTASAAEFAKDLLSAKSAAEFAEKLLSTASTAELPKELPRTASAAEFTKKLLTTTSAAEFTKKLLSTASTAEFTEKLLSTASAAEFAKELLSTASAAEFAEKFRNTASAADLSKQLLSTASTAEFAEKLLSTASAAEFAKELLSTASDDEFNEKLQSTTSAVKFIKKLLSTASDAKFVKDLLSTVSAAKFAKKLQSTPLVTKLPKELSSTASAIEFGEKLLSTASAAKFAKELLSTASATEFAKELLSTASATEFAKKLLSTASAAEFAKDLLSTASAAELAKKLLSAASAAELPKVLQSAASAAELAKELLSKAPAAELPKELLSTASATEFAKTLLSTESAAEFIKKLLGAVSAAGSPKELPSTASTAEFAKKLLSAASAAEFAEKLLSTASTSEFANELLSTASVTNLPKELLSTASATDLSKALVSTASATEFAKELLSAASAAEFAKRLLGTASAAECAIVSLQNRDCSPLWDTTAKLLELSLQDCPLAKHKSEAIRHAIRADTYIYHPKTNDLSPASNELGKILSDYKVDKVFNLSKMPLHELLKGTIPGYAKEFILKFHRYLSAKVVEKANTLTSSDLDLATILAVTSTTSASVEEPKKVETSLRATQDVLKRVSFGAGLAARMPSLCTDCQILFEDLPPDTQYNCFAACRDEFISDLKDEICNLLQSKVPSNSENFDPVRDLMWIVKTGLYPDDNLPEDVLSVLNSTPLTPGQLAALLFDQPGITDDGLKQVITKNTKSPSEEDTESPSKAACFILYYYRTMEEPGESEKAKVVIQFLVDNGLFEATRESLIRGFPLHARKILNLLIRMVVGKEGDEQKKYRQLKAFTVETFPYERNRWRWSLELVQSDALHLDTRMEFLRLAPADLGENWPLGYSVESVIGNFKQHSPLVSFVKNRSFPDVLGAASQNKHLRRLCHCLIADRISKSANTPSVEESWVTWNQRALRMLAGEHLDDVLNDAPEATRTEARAYPSKGLARVSASLRYGSPEAGVSKEECHLRNIWPETIGSDYVDYDLFGSVLSILAQHRQGLGMANLLLNSKEININLDSEDAPKGMKSDAWALTMHHVHTPHELEVLIAHLDPSTYDALQAIAPESPVWPRAAVAVDYALEQRATRVDLAANLSSFLSEGKHAMQALAFMLLPLYGSEQDYQKTLAKFGETHKKKLNNNTGEEPWKSIPLILAQRIVEKGWLETVLLKPLNSSIGRLLPTMVLEKGKELKVTTMKLFNANFKAASKEQWESIIKAIIEAPLPIKTQGELLATAFEGFNSEVWSSFIQTTKIPLMPILGRAGPRPQFNGAAEGLCGFMTLELKKATPKERALLENINMLEILASHGRLECAKAFYQHLRSYLKELKKSDVQAFEGENIDGRLEARLKVNFKENHISASALAPLAVPPDDIFVTALSGPKELSGEGYEDFSSSLQQFVQDAAASTPSRDSTKYVLQKYKLSHESATLNAQLSSPHYRVAFKLLIMLGTEKFNLLAKLLNEANSEIWPSRDTFLDYASLVVQQGDSVKSMCSEAEAQGSLIHYVDPDIGKRRVMLSSLANLTTTQHEIPLKYSLDKAALEFLSPPFQKYLLSTPSSLRALAIEALDKSTLPDLDPRVLTFLTKSQVSELGLSKLGTLAEEEGACHILASEPYIRELWAADLIHFLPPQCLQKAQTFWSLAFIDRNEKNQYGNAEELARILTKENFKDMSHLRAKAVRVPAEFWSNLGTAMELEEPQMHPCRSLPTEMMHSDDFWPNATLACLSSLHESSGKRVIDLATLEQRELISAEIMQSLSTSPEE